MQIHHIIWSKIIWFLYNMQVIELIDVFIQTERYFEIQPYKV